MFRYYLGEKMNNNIFNFLYEVSSECTAEKLSDIITKHYSQKHRFWHTIEHLNHMMENRTNNPFYYSLEFRLAVLFHDIYYDPRSNQNEEKSCDFFNKTLNEYKYNLLVSDSVVEKVNKLILATKTPEKHLGKKTDEGLFVEKDFDIFNTNSLNEIMKYEDAISKEYQYVGYTEYKRKRLEFLRQPFIQKRFGKNNLYHYLIEYVETRVPRIGLYAGSFNPFHVGHLSVLREAEKRFDMVYLAIGCNPEKTYQSSIMSRAGDFANTLPFHHIEAFEGFLFGLVKKLENDGIDVTVIRGLRTDTDFKKEEADLRFSQDLYPKMKVDFIACEKKYEHISSSAIRQLMSIDNAAGKKYIPTLHDIYGDFQ